MNDSLRIRPSVELEYFEQLRLTQWEWNKHVRHQRTFHHHPGIDPVWTAPDQAKLWDPCGRCTRWRSPGKKTWNWYPWERLAISRKMWYLTRIIHRISLSNIYSHNRRYTSIHSRGSSVCGSLGVNERHFRNNIKTKMFCFYQTTQALADSVG